MKDIDFDELDRAVNSLMGGVKAGSDTSSSKSLKTLDINTTLKDGEQPAYDKLRRVAEKIGSETIQQPNETTEIIPQGAPGPVQEAAPIVPQPPVQSPAPAVEPAAAPKESVIIEPRKAMEPRQKSSGRFMDVMHPSSDMTTQSVGTTTVPPATPIQPVSPVVAVPERPLKTDPVPVVSEPEVVSEPVPVAPSPEPVGPPPVDTPPEPALPLTSPFLPDPKVEKRPLGGVPAVNESEQETLGADVSLLDAPLKTDMAHDAQVAPQSVEPELPAEFHSDLLAIETNAVEGASEETEPEAESPIDVAKEPAVQEPATVSSDVEALSEASAPQPQPATEPTEDEHPEDGAIFDTSQYHTPVVQHAKRGREWLWVVVIIVIVIISAAGGVAFYLLGA